MSTAERVYEFREGQPMFDNVKLLVVDDEEVIRQACRRILSPHGFQVDTTGDAIDGLHRAAEGAYAAILLDINMAELDGIRFLEQLRETKPDIPVILITGYPTMQNAVSAVRLGATDYVTKPFAPEEIVRAVQGSLRPRKTKQTEPSTSASQMVEPWVPATQEFRFWNESWLQSGQDETVRAGAMLTRAQGENLEAVRLPRIGETVYQGLPLAGLRIAEELELTLSAPVSGVVVAVNEQLLKCPSMLASDPFGDGWVACICPTRGEEESQNCRLRRVILANADAVSANEQCAKLSKLGCQVNIVKSWKDLAPTLIEADDAILMIDAASFGEPGLDLVGRTNEASPSMKIVVVASPECKWEAAYRERRILYYAVRPFDDNEIVDILNAAFRSRGHLHARVEYSKAPPQPVSGFCITNGTGKKVRLVAATGLLRCDDGLGGQISHKLRDRLYAVEVTEDEVAAITPVALLDAARTCDRLLVLLAKDTGRLPGSLVRDTLGGFASALCENSGNITTLVVQPPSPGDRCLEFDERTTAALAEHIAQEMALCYQVARDNPAVWQGHCECKPDGNGRRAG